MSCSRTDRLQAQLEAYVLQDLYPFHMPGHKRRCAPASSLPYQTDLTEVEGVDDLHHAQGILRAAMDRTAALFGSSRCWYLVGGSTVGNLAGIRAIAPYGSEVIVARNCHKSVYHAIELCHLNAHWIWPSWDAEYEIFGSIAPEMVARALAQYPASRAVILTSPTYEGVVSDIEAIAEICHHHQCAMPLLVDEAHGAHFGLFEKDFFPDSAIHCGADVVVQSAHKTLPSLTQTALLHQNGSLVSPEKIEAQLDVFETSSPSYPLMASLDGCTGLLESQGALLFSQWRGRLEAFSARLQERPLQHLQVLCCGADKPAYHEAFYAFDPGKILIRVSGREKGDGNEENIRSGSDLARALRDAGIETEMHIGRNVLCMTSCCDTKEGFSRLLQALYQIDDRMQAAAETVSADISDDASRCSEVFREADALPIGEAVRQKTEWVPISSCKDRLAGEYIYPYPPGIPIVVPGETLTEEKLKILSRLRLQGAVIQRSSQSQDPDKILCLQNTHIVSGT